MIGHTNEDMKNGSAWKMALRDAIIVGAIQLLTLLLFNGYPPNIEILYMSGLTALLIGGISFANAMRIKLDLVRKQ
jgi:ABC-type uncharacterized transport system permease subunit